jgi:hypothetical protein
MHADGGVEEPGCSADVPNPIEIATHVFEMRPAGGTVLPGFYSNPVWRQGPGCSDRRSAIRKADALSRYPTSAKTSGEIWGTPRPWLHPIPYPLHPVLPLCYHPCFRGCSPGIGLKRALWNRGNPMPEEDQVAGPPARKRCAPGHIPPRFRRLPRRLPDIPVPAVTVGFSAAGIYLLVSVATARAGFVKYGRLRSNGAANLNLKTRRSL